MQYFAAVGRDGKAKCRPFMLCREGEGGLCFCTGSQKSVYQDLRADPYLEVPVSSPEFAWIRLKGKAVFEKNMAAQGICRNKPIAKSRYKTAGNPIFQVFYLENAKAVIADFSGLPPREYTL